MSAVFNDLLDSLVPPTEYQQPGSPEPLLPFKSTEPGTVDQPRMAAIDTQQHRWPKEVLDDFLDAVAPIPDGPPLAQSTPKRKHPMKQPNTKSRTEELYKVVYYFIVLSYDFIF